MDGCLKYTFMFIWTQKYLGGLDGVLFKYTEILIQKKC